MRAQRHQPMPIVINCCLIMLLIKCCSFSVLKLAVCHRSVWWKWIGLDVGQNVDSPPGLDWIELDWVSKMLDWVGSGLEKWTHWTTLRLRLSSGRSRKIFKCTANTIPLRSSRYVCSLYRVEPQRTAA